MFQRRVIALHAILVVGVSITLTSCVRPPDIVPSPSSSEPAPNPIPSPAPTPVPDPIRPPITIDTPEDGAVTSVPVSLHGMANTCEATFVVDVVNQAGDAVCTRTVTATPGSGELGTWEATLAFPPPDANTPMTLRAYSLSAEDGSMQHLVERRVTVSADRPPIFLTSPVCGAVMTQPGEQFLVEGRAAVFEAALAVEFRDAAGAVRISENLMTDVGNEEFAFSAYLKLPEDASAGLYDVVAFSYSALDGSIQDEFAVQVLVQP
jgi:Immunoglobulin-like domain of bacterial spore germination